MTSIETSEQKDTNDSQMILGGRIICIPSLGDRIRQVRKTVNMNQQVFSEPLTVQKISIRNYELGRRTPDAIFIGELCRIYNVTANWLLFGEGEMFDDSSEKKHENNDLSFVPVCDEETSELYGCFVESDKEKSRLAFSTQWIEGKNLTPKNLMILTQKGDSMEPTISEGDTLLIDTRTEKITNDSIYIIRKNRTLMPKRIQQNIDGSVRIISDNQKYNEEIIPEEKAKNITISGKVIFIGHEI